MSKIKQVEDAIEKALRRESKLTHEALMVPALSSLNIRHLMNNLGAISKNYLEHGVHKGGLFCSAIYKNSNLEVVTAVDNWESDTLGEEKAESQFDENSFNSIAEGTTQITIKSNSFDVSPDSISEEIDLYLFDADHSEDSQCRALTHFISAMADEFVFCVDDWDFPEVSAGTRRGLKETGVEILFEHIEKGNNHDNDHWWNGFGIFVLKKIK